MDKRLLEQNFTNLTPEEHKKRASNGGKKSGEVRRRKRDLRQAMDLFLSLKVKNPELVALMKAAGIKGAELDNQMAMVYAQVSKAQSGSTRAAELIADVLGERQVVESKNNNIDEQDDPMTSSIKEMLGLEDKANNNESED